MPLTLQTVSQKLYKSKQTGSRVQTYWSVRSCTAEKNQHKLLHTVIFIPPTHTSCQILPHYEPWSKCIALLIQRHVPCYITHCSVLHHMPLTLTFLIIYFCQPVNGLLQASATRCRLYQEWSSGWVGGGRRERCSWNRGAGPAQSVPAHLCSPPRACSDPLFRSQQWRKCQSRSRPGNLHAQTRRFLSWHGSSCGLCKDFPAFHSLPVYVSLSHSFGWLPFGKLPQSSGLFFFPCVRSGGVEVCAGACVDAFYHYLTPARVYVATNSNHMQTYVDVWCTEDPRRDQTLDKAINLILLLSDICFTAVWPDLFLDTPLLSLWGLRSTFICKDRIMKSSDEMLLNTLQPGRTAVIKGDDDTALRTFIIKRTNNWCRVGNY